MTVRVLTVIDNDNGAIITVQSVMPFNVLPDIERAEELFRRESGRAFVEGFKLSAETSGTLAEDRIQVWTRGNVVRSIYSKRCEVG